MEKTAMEDKCPLCGREMKRRRKPYLLNGYSVCKKCYYGFTNRRQAAFVVDWIGYQILQFVVGFAFGYYAVLSGNEEVINWIGTVISWGMLPIFLCKDGMSGVSPGKALMGVRVVDVETGMPIGPLASFKRNLPLVIPFMPLIIAATMGKGQRIGDGWAHTQVVWNEYAESPIFSVCWPSMGPAQFAAEAIPILEPVPEDDNPYRSPM